MNVNIDRFIHLSGLTCKLAWRFHVVWSLGNKDFITRGSVTQDHTLQHFLLASPKQCSISVYNIKSEPHFHTTWAVRCLLSLTLNWVWVVQVITISLYCDIIAAWIWVMEPMNMITDIPGCGWKRKVAWISGQSSWMLVFRVYLPVCNHFSRIL